MNSRIKRLLASIVFTLFLGLLNAATAQAQADCRFVLGFKVLRDLIGHEIVGECLDNEHYNDIGDSNQHTTTGGLLAWRKADNWTAFTDGYRTWINGPNGLVQRLNTERFEWEADYAEITGQATASALTRDALRNAEYQIYGEGVRLSDGFLARKLEIGQESWQLHDPIAFGDLNGDGVADAAVVLSYNGGGSGTFYGLLAVLNENGVPVHVASTELGDRIRLNSLAIAADVITVKMVAHGPNDGLCCPTIDTVATFRLNGNALELLSEVPRGQLTAMLEREEGPASDPTLAHAFDVMRSTPTGNEVAEMFVRSNASAQFGPLGDSRSQWESNPRRITIHEQYRHESPEVLAYTLIWPTVGLALYADSGVPQSWEACMLRLTGQHVAQAQWWLEKLGAGGKQSPTQLEIGANNTLASYREGRLESWVRSSGHYREYCTNFGEPTPAPTPTPVTPLRLPWDYLEIDLGNLLEKEGYTRGRSGFGLMYNHLSGKYGYLPHSLFLAWLDAGGRGVGDATPELWQDFYRAFLFNQEFRGLSINAVRKNLEANTHLGSVMTAFLKADFIGSLDDRITFVARVEDALRVGGILGVDATAGCSIHCQHVKVELRDYLVGKDLATITAIPSPWPLYKN